MGREWKTWLLKRQTCHQISCKQKLIEECCGRECTRVGTASLHVSLCREALGSELMGGVEDRGVRVDTESGDPDGSLVEGAVIGQSIGNVGRGVGVHQGWDV